MFFRFILLMMTLLMIGNCDTTITTKYSYHPYLTNRLCPLVISGSLDEIESISILLDQTNVFDVDPEVVEELGIHTDPNAEYKLPLKINPKNVFFHKIPCRNQTIRIRYLLNGIEKSLDFHFEKDQKKKFVIKKDSKLGELYVEN
ncbi:hypothetical protein EHQ94_03820 [Leptospira meyeri]|uniref:hypothetical protein n=1 Tax=Leptospira meyeri TaxID=29508 RepID=UPI00108388DB|nr:hypothetical protein [Leptospira meyeri]TGM62544.1 hypothetical protein EHQ93_14775 [Leptospira meyeri]TGM71151.1 hypothetical protein EHQ94_03820 [Leptospira meyeri]